MNAEHIRNVAVELAYGVLVFCAWRWAISGVAGVWHVWRATDELTPWRWRAAAWLVAKASFFTWVASVWWFDWFNEWAHASAIFVLAFFHWIAYRAWLKLPKEYRPITGKPNPAWGEKPITSSD